MANTAGISIPTSLVGASGLVGNFILSTLLTHPRISAVTTFSRKPLTNPDPSSRLLDPIVTSDSSSWPSSFPTGPSILFSGLGTTRANAGGLANQRKIDLDLNVDMAKAAKDAGVKVYVLISAHGANSKSISGYTKMKGELEEAVAELGFEKVILVKPGLITGNRHESRPAEAAIRAVADGLGRVSGGKLKDFWAQDAEVIARAAVAAGVMAVDGTGEAQGKGGVWTVGMGDIVRLGRTEWKD